MCELNHEPAPISACGRSASSWSASQNYSPQKQTATTTTPLCDYACSSCGMSARVRRHRRILSSTCAFWSGRREALGIRRFRIGCFRIHLAMRCRSIGSIISLSWISICPSWIRIFCGRTLEPVSWCSLFFLREWFRRFTLSPFFCVWACFCGPLCRWLLGFTRTSGGRSLLCGYTQFCPFWASSHRGLRLHSSRMKTGWQFVFSMALAWTLTTVVIIPSDYCRQHDICWCWARSFWRYLDCSVCLPRLSSILRICVPIWPVFWVPWPSSWIFWAHGFFCRWRCLTIRCPLGLRPLINLLSALATACITPSVIRIIVRVLIAHWIAQLDLIVCDPFS